MTTVNECPICMDPIETTRNCLTTECGHCFHTNCLMTSVAHNGFGCPYCRTKMAEEIVEDEESQYEDEESQYEDEQYDDDALRSFRFFNNIVNGEEHDPEDLDEEEEENSEESVHEDEPVEEEVPSPAHIAQKLLEQGITVESFVKMILLDRVEYEREYEDFERVESEVYGRLRTILNNYTPTV